MRQSPENLTDATEIVIGSVLDIWNSFLAHLPLFVVALIVIFVTGFIAKIGVFIVGKALTRARLRSSLRDLLKQLTYIAIWIVGLLITAVILFPDLTPAKAIGVLGIGSLAIGFAFKDIFENFFAGILILWRYPFDPGDFIEVNDITGRVEDITIRMTIIRQTDGQLVTIPNSILFKDPVHVLTYEKTRRVTIICGVAYGEDVDESRTVITNAVKACKTVNDAKPVEIFAQEFADSSINFEITWWTGSKPLEVRQSRDEVVAAVKRGLDKAGIEIPFPYRTLTFKSDSPLIARMNDRGQDQESSHES